MNVLQSKVGKIVAGAAAVLLAGGIATASVVVGEQRRAAEAAATEAAYVTSITIRAVEDEAQSTERVETRVATQKAAADAAAARAAADAQAAAVAAQAAADEQARIAAEAEAPEYSEEEPGGDDGLPAGAWPLPWIESPDPINAPGGGRWDMSECYGHGETIGGVQYCIP